MNTESLKNKLSEKITDIDTSENKNVVTEVVDESINTEYVALQSNVMSIINDNLKNNCISRSSIDTVKSPSGDTLVFTVPTLMDDVIEKELVGVILGYTTPRAYWETSNPVEGAPPTCFSLDSITSTDDKACCNCAYNEFGSKENGESNAKACKESIEIYLLREDNIMPIVVRVPVSSKMIFQKYLLRLVSNMYPIYGVVTKITLEKATNKTGQSYGKFKFQVDKVLGNDEINAMKNYSKNMMNLLTETSEDLKSIS